MRDGYERDQIDRIISVMRDSMRALVARVVSTHDNELSLVQRTLQGTYSGWDTKDIPANLSMLLRDFAIRRDSRVDTDIAKITSAFDMIEKMVREFSGYDEMEIELPDDDETSEQEPASVRLVEPARVEERPVDVGAKILDVLKKSSEAKSLDDLIAECCERDRADRAEFSNAIRTLQESGALIEVDLDTYQVIEAQQSWG